jgi:hypothetical protein
VTPERANELADCWIEMVMPNYKKAFGLDESMSSVFRIVLAEAFKTGIVVGMMHHDHEGIVKPDRIQKN